MAEQPLIGYLISQYLIHSYLYYICNMSVIPDYEFDMFCKEMLERWDEVQACNHPHKHLVSRDSLEAGTGFCIRMDEYPLIVQSCATDVAKEAGKVIYDKKRKMWYSKP